MPPGFPRRPARLRDGVPPPGSSGAEGEPAVPGHDELGPQTSEPDSHAIMDRALELGINFFDTANVYGQRKGVGTTETIVGNWFAKGDGRRDKVVLATKVYSEMGSWPNESRSRRSTSERHEDSLRRLQTDHLDMYQMHHVPRGDVGRDLAGVRDARPAGQGHLRGVEQLRRLAHREGERGREGSPLPRARVRAVHLQPRRADGRARGAPGVRGLRDGRDPVEPAVARPAGGRPRRRGREGTRRASSMVQDKLASTALRSRRTRSSAPSSASPGGGRARMAARQPGGHRADHRPADPRAARGGDALD